MSNYTKSTNFTAKDSLPTGDTNKVIRGTEFDTEFDAIATAVGTKSDLAGPTFTGTATFANLTATGTVNLTGATVSNLGTVTTVDIDGGTIDGATIGANSASTGNFTTLSINGTAITATGAELNILDGVTASTAEINLLDGVTATTAELNILDGVTATAVELNTLDGVTASTAELNLLDGVTATTAELNFVDGVTSNIQTQLDAKGTASSLSDLGVTATASELNTLDGITSSTAELNLLDGVTATTAELNYVDGVTSNIQTQLDAKGTVSNLSDLSITATAAEINTLDGITATTAELNILDGKAFLDEDDLSSDSATGIPSQQSVKAYVDSQTGGGGTTLSGLTDTNITSPADAALLFYDTGTSKWIDNVVSGDITIADTGVAAIGSGVIVDADVNASAAIAVSKTALIAGTGLTLTTNTLSVDAAQSQITSVGTLSSLSVSGTLTLGGTDITSTAAEINILDGVTATTTEINYVDGVTSNVQTQLDSKIGATYTGDVNITGELLVDSYNETFKRVTSSSNATTVNCEDGNVFEHELSENTTFTFSNPPASGTPVTANGYNLSIASYDSVSFSVASQASIPTGIAFNSTGTKMFIVDNSGDDVNEYSLSSAFDVSTASYTQNFSVSSQDTIPTDIQFNLDGTKMFILGYSGQDVNEYHLTTGFDISTASYDSSFSVASQEPTPGGMAFNNDGTKMYVCGYSNSRVDEYDLSTGFDVSSATHSQNFSVSSQDTVPDGIAFNSDGTKMFIVGDANNNVYEYTLTTGFDVGTASYSSVSFSTATQDTSPYALAFSSNGSKMFLLGKANTTVFQYSTSTSVLNDSTAYGMSLKVVQDSGASGYTVTWPTSVDWPAATAPTLTATASAVDQFVFYTYDGGTNWYGFTAGQALG